MTYDSLIRKYSREQVSGLRHNTQQNIREALFSVNYQVIALIQEPRPLRFLYINFVHDSDFEFKFSMKVGNAKQEQNTSLLGRPSTLADSNSSDSFEDSSKSAILYSNVIHSLNDFRELYVYFVAIETVS